MSVSLQEYLKDKRVAFVGPAAYAEKRTQGRLIDSYDVVARMLMSLPIPSEHHGALGSRTDIVVASLIGDRGIHKYPTSEVVPERLAVIAEAGKFLCPIGGGMSWEIGKSLRTIEGTGAQTIAATQAEYDDLREQIGAAPTTGIAAIAHFLRLDISELFLTGFTFDLRISPRSESYTTRIVDLQNCIDGWHNIAKETAWFKGVLRSDRRMKIDTFMRPLFLEGS